MAVRLRPQSSAWLAPTALAAQLTAQTGQIAGQGVASLLGGIAQGVGAYTEKREKRRVEAINERRYQDSLTRQDRSFQYGAAKDQASLLEDYLKGAEMEAALSAMSSPTGTPDPSKVQNLRTAQSSMNALRSQLAKIGGVQAAEMPPMPEPPPMATGSFTPKVQEEYRKQVGYESLSDDELVTVATSLAADAETMKAELDAIVKVGGVKGAMIAAAKRTAYGDKAREAALAEATLKRRQEQAKVAQREAERKAPEAVELGTPAKERAERDKVLDATRYAMSIGYEGGVFPNIEAANDWIHKRQITDPNNAATAARKADAARVRAENQQKLVDYRLRASKALADHVASIKEPAARAKAMQTAIENQQQLVKELRTKYEMLKSLQGKGLVGENDPDVVGGPGKPSAYDQYEAENDLLTEMVKQSLQGASSAPIGGGYPSWLPPEEKQAWDAMPESEKAKAIEKMGR